MRARPCATVSSWQRWTLAYRCETCKTPPGTPIRARPAGTTATGIPSIGPQRTPSPRSLRRDPPIRPSRNPRTPSLGTRLIALRRWPARVAADTTTKGEHHLHHRREQNFLTTRELHARAWRNLLIVVQRDVPLGRRARSQARPSAALQVATARSGMPISDQAPQRRTQRHRQVGQGHRLSVNSTS